MASQPTQQTIQAFVANVDAWAASQLYGTPCSMTLSQLWQEALLLMAATNTCFTLTQEQSICFQSLLSQAPC